MRKAAHGSALEIFHSLMILLKAIPAFVNAQVNNEKSPTLFSDTLYCVYSDLLPMLFTYYLYAVITGETTDSTLNDNNKTIAAQMGVFFIATLSAIFVARQKIRFLVHSIVLSITNPSRFADAAKLQKEKFSEKKSKPDAIWYELCDVIYFFVQSMLIPGLQIIPYIGWIIATVSKMLLTAQTALSFSLSSKNISGDYREIYYQHYPEFVLTTGLAHSLMSYLIAKQCEYIPGVKQENIEPMIGAILSLYLTAILYHADLPKPVESTNRKFYDPLTVVRRALLQFMNFIGPSIKHFLDKKAEQKKNETWVLMRDFITQIPEQKQIKWVLQLPFTQKLFLQLSPILQREFHSLLNDPILIKHWPAVAESITHHIKSLLKIRPHAVKIAGAIELYQKSGRAATEAASAISIFLPFASALFPQIAAIFTAASYAAQAIKTTGTLKAAACFIGKSNSQLNELCESLNKVPKFLICVMVSALKSELFVQDCQKILLVLETALTNYLNQRVKSIELDEKDKLYFDDLIRELEATFYCVPENTELETHDSPVTGAIVVGKSPIVQTIPNFNAAIKTTSSGNGGKTPRFLGNQADSFENIPDGNSEQFHEKFNKSPPKDVLTF